jgi:hypothetical protein
MRAFFRGRRAVFVSIACAAAVTFESFVATAVSGAAVADSSEIQDQASGAW